MKDSYIVLTLTNVDGVRYAQSTHPQSKGYAPIDVAKAGPILEAQFALMDGDGQVDTYAIPGILWSTLVQHFQGEPLASLVEKRAKGVAARHALVGITTPDGIVRSAVESLLAEAKGAQYLEDEAWKALQRDMAPKPDPTDAPIRLAPPRRRESSPGTLTLIERLANELIGRPYGPQVTLLVAPHHVGPHGGREYVGTLVHVDSETITLGPISANSGQEVILAASAIIGYMRHGA